MTYDREREGPLTPDDWEEATGEVPVASIPSRPAPQVEQVKAFPNLTGFDQWLECTGCGAHAQLKNLSSKYGNPQLVGQVREKGLWEAKCTTCNNNPKKKGMQAIWKEQ